MMCLSNGGADGLGKIREKELEKSCANLKFTEEPLIIEDPDLQDGMQTQWPSEVVATHVKKYLTSKQKEGKSIDMIVTFDSFGVSNHPNHRAVHQGVSDLLERREICQKDGIELFTLTTVGLWRKYTAYFDIVIAGPDEYHCFNWNWLSAYEALRIHSSQFVWFRRLSVLFSRYTFSNSFERFVEKGRDPKDKKSEEIKEIDSNSKIHDT